MILKPCPHCGMYDWTQAPTLKKILSYLRYHDVCTSRDVAQHLGISIQNASNQMHKLVKMELAWKYKTQNVPEGGTEIVYSAEKPR